MIHRQCLTYWKWKIQIIYAVLAMVHNWGACQIKATISGGGTSVTLGANSAST